MAFNCSNRRFTIGNKWAGSIFNQNKIRMKKFINEPVNWLIIGGTAVICAASSLAISGDATGPEVIPSIVLAFVSYGVWAKVR